MLIFVGLGGGAGAAFQVARRRVVHGNVAGVAAAPEIRGVVGVQLGPVVARHPCHHLSVRFKPVRRVFPRRSGSVYRLEGPVNTGGGRVPQRCPPRQHVKPCRTLAQMPVFRVPRPAIAFDVPSGTSGRVGPVAFNGAAFPCVHHGFPFAVRSASSRRTTSAFSASVSGSAAIITRAAAKCSPAPSAVPALTAPPTFAGVASAGPPCPIPAPSVQALVQALVGSLVSSCGCVPSVRCSRFCKPQVRGSSPRGGFHARRRARSRSVAFFRVHNRLETGAPFRCVHRAGERAPRRAAGARPRSSRVRRRALSQLSPACRRRVLLHAADRQRMKSATAPVWL